MKYILPIMILILLLTACKKNGDKPEYAAGTNENINTWILDSLKRYYYWTDVLPERPDINKAPLDFFASVRNSGDRFSYLLLPGDPSTITKNNKNLYGFDYTTITEQKTGLVFGIVKFVLNDSPASRSGLKRGDYISKINNKQLNTGNAATLQEELLSGTNVTLGIAEIAGTELKDINTLNLTSGFTFEQPSLSRIIENGNAKTGYLYVNDFNTGLAASLYQTFAAFKAAGVSELILDLRYNAGGQVAEAAGLCAMIAPGISYATPFITYQGNKNGGIRTESIGDAATFDLTVDFNTALQNSLNLSRIFILGTGTTASASEVMINNLKPLMKVVLIGEKTRGKDEASFEITDTRIPKQVDWVMHPIVYKLFNAAGNGGYSSGITPDLLIEELAFLPLQEFGSAEDPLIKSAITQISGGPAISGLALKAKSDGLAAGAILTDTRMSTTTHSIVFTHH